MFDELLRLLAEFGANEETTALAERLSQTVPPADADETWTAPADVEPLTADELDSLLAALMGLAEDDEASVALLTEAANGAEAIRVEQAARVAEAEAEEQALAEQRARLRGETEQASDTGDEGDEGDADDESADDADGSADAPPAEGAEGDAADETTDAPAMAGAPAARTVQPSPEARAAARRSMSARRPASAAPAPTTQDGAVITIAADVPGFAGGQVATLRNVDEAVFNRVSSFRGSQGRRKSGDRGKATAPGEDWLTVASIHGHYPENRRLTDDPNHNARIIEEALRGATTPQALTASGGLCAPLQPYYGIQTLGNARRPVRDALPAFQGGSGRGGLISMSPLVLADVAGASIIWTAENDEDPDDPATKPCIRVECNDLRTTEIYAIPMCLEFGNFRARTFGEFDTAASDLALVAHARVAEIQLLADIQADSLNLTDQDTTVSAYRDWLAMLVQAAAGYRQRVRDEDLMFRVITTALAPAIFSIDFLRGMAGGIGYNEVLRRGRSEIAADLAAHGINVTWSPDMNIPGPQAAATALAALPPTIDAAFYPEGTFVLLDEGRLDLGVVRDSTLNSTNDFQMFAEDFEAVHHLGHDSYWLTANVCPSGAVNGTLDPAALCASYT
jgi:hypothetical protein